jgi:hypothetical protein
MVKKKNRKALKEAFPSIISHLAPPNVKQNNNKRWWCGYKKIKTAIVKEHTSQVHHPTSIIEISSLPQV